MATAKKVEMTPEERYIQDRLRDGTCVRQEFSMKVLGTPDTTYQARVDKLDVAHAKRFADHIQDGGVLWPVVIFQAIVGRKVRALLADGFHRHHAYASLKRPSILAYVITVPEDQLEHETRLYSSMCNQLATKGRTREDVRKAVEMLLADPVCRNWTDMDIARHCGLSAKTVKNYRIKYCEANSIELPDYTRLPATPKIYENSCGYRGFFTHVGGRSHYLGKSRDEAEANFPGKIEEISRNNVISKNALGDIKTLCARRGIVLTAMGNPPNSGMGQVFVFNGGLIAPAWFREGGKISEVVGRIVLNRQKAFRKNPTSALIRSIIVCDMIPKGEAFDFACELGFEFLTPDGLVASLTVEFQEGIPGPVS